MPYQLPNKVQVHKYWSW